MRGWRQVLKCIMLLRVLRVQNNQVQVRSNAGLDRGALTVTTSGNNVTIAAGTLAATDEVLIIQH